MCGIYSPHNVAQEKQSLKEKKKIMHKSLCLHMGVIKEFVWYLRGAVELKHQFFTALFLFVCCVCLHAVYQLSGSVCKSTWRYNRLYSASYLHIHVL